MSDGFDSATWWQPLYDDIVAEMFLGRRDPAEVATITAFLRDALRLDSGHTVFDQCCGIGTFAFPLAEAGVRVVGVDQSEAYIRRAKEAAGASPCEFFAADAFTFAPAVACDAAFNWGTGFGNALSDDRNREMLRRAFECLKAGGRFLLDYQHVPRVLRHFQQSLTHRLRRPDGEVLLLRESKVELVVGALRQTWTFLLPDGKHYERASAVRLYLPHQLGEMLREVGFVDVQFFGGTDRQPLDLDSPRCVAVGTRPA
ncbi:MAG TPA: methyltransferase domain-containing protein [Gemmataceae bacterium]|nr:methyltransferase domain-containing protein [Gemmataceae bacterium]